MASTAWSLLMLLVVIALIPLALSALKRLQTFRPGGGAHRLEVSAQLALGTRERLVMVRVDDRMLVLGVTPQQITLLSESETGPAAAFPAAAQPPGNPGFGALLRTMAGARTPRLP